MSSSQKRYLFGRQTSYNFGKALQFDGVNDYCDLVSAVSGSSLTVSVWFKIDFSGVCRFLGSDNLTDWIDIRTSTNIINIRAGSGGVSFNVQPISLNTWHHLLFADSGSGAKVFLNSVESSNGTQILNNTYTYKYIGRQETLFYKIILDDLLITNTYGDPQAQATALYNNGLGVDPLTVIPTARQLYRFNGNPNNDGTLGGVAVLNNFIADPYVNH